MTNAVFLKEAARAITVVMHKENPSAKRGGKDNIVILQRQALMNAETNQTVGFPPSFYPSVKVAS